MTKPIPKDILKIAARLSRESGAPLDNILHEHNMKAERVEEMCKSDSGKCKVIGVDKFDGEDWVHNEYDSFGVALGEARRLTNEAKPSASSHSVATVYYAYAPNGTYLGGDTWVNE